MPTAKRNLVIVRAGDRSLHPAWTADRATRTWDLVVSYFGSDPGRFRDSPDPRMDDPGLKYPGLHSLLRREGFWRAYEYIWLPDDDLAIEQGGIDALFREMDALHLDLAQPALSWKSHFSHAITLRHSLFRARYTNFVEVMAPCFHRDFLDTCLGALAESMSGWGLDWVFPRLCPDPAHRCAIIDAVEMTHTRPVGGPTYAALRERGISAAEEGAALMERYGITLGGAPSVLGAVTVDGRSLDGARPNDAAAIAALLSEHDRARRAACGSFTSPQIRFELSPRGGSTKWGW